MREGVGLEDEVGDNAQDQDGPHVFGAIGPKELGLPLELGVVLEFKGN